MDTTKEETRSSLESCGRLCRSTTRPRRTGRRSLVERPRLKRFTGKLKRYLKRTTAARIVCTSSTAPSRS
ncbi:hypothetical protein L596_023921 [Steinernema carpocapsae]|uniref:Uncharacterized protein n=1 Tax=Steinernema carpocapsae TaxID=34508 RepID=A0A4U5MF59_STECR|nr:hypothetical protein L596_023921 [Steinernema carpocapsae]